MADSQGDLPKARASRDADLLPRARSKALALAAVLRRDAAALEEACEVSRQAHLAAAEAALVVAHRLRADRTEK